MRIPLAFILYMFILAPGTAQTDPEVIDVPHFIRIDESGGFLGKLWSNMDTQEATGTIASICAVFDCEEAVPAIAAGIHNTQVQTGADFSTDGHIDQHNGEHWDISFPGPPGYVTCSAALDPASYSVGNETHSSGSIFRVGGDFLGSDDDVPFHKQAGQWVHANFVVKYVLAGTENKHSCLPNATHIWCINSGLNPC